VTNDPLLFERASRYHDLGTLRPCMNIAGKRQRDQNFAAASSDERIHAASTGQLRKLDEIVTTVRRHARRVYDATRDLPGIRFRRLARSEETSDPQGF